MFFILVVQWVANAILNVLTARVTFQAIKAEFPASLLLWRERECHQDTNLDYLDSQLTAQCDAKRIKTFVELFGLCYNGQNNPDVPCRLL